MCVVGYVLSVCVCMCVCVCLCVYVQRSRHGPLALTATWLLSPPRHLTVPLPSAELLFHLHWLLPVYFLFAVGYDVMQSVFEIAWSLSHSRPGPGPGPGPTPQGLHVIYNSRAM